MMLLSRAGIIGATAVAPPTAVTFGQVVVNVQAAGESSWSYSNHNLAAEDNLILILVGYQRSDYATGASYAGTAATFLGEYQVSNRRVSGFYVLKANLPSPGSGKTFGVEFTGGARGFCLCAALRGAAQSAPAQNGAAGSVSSLGPTAVTVGAGGAVVQGALVNGHRESSIAPGAGEDLIFAQQMTGGTVELTGLYSSKSNQSGSPSMSVSWSGATNASHIVVGVSPG